MRRRGHHRSRDSGRCRRGRHRLVVGRIEQRFDLRQYVVRRRLVEQRRDWLEQRVRQQRVVQWRVREQRIVQR
jgi:hypothetical protein